jgi:serine/threonine-protein kinase
MEYVDGVSLGEALRQVGRFAPADAVAIIAQVLDALAAAHALDIVHRDVKPANILLLADGTVKVTDFGISRLNTSDITLGAALVGTPAYMSPEQCRGESVDPRSDLFSAGAVLFELLSGERPFPGKTTVEVTLKISTADPADLASLATDAPERLVKAVLRALEKPRSARFASAREMADTVREAMLDSVPARPERPARPDRAERPDRPAGAGARSPTRPVEFDDITLDSISRQLARHIGPIARYLVHGAARQSDTVEAVCESVARNIAAPAERETFLSGVLALLRRDAIAPSGPAAKTLLEPVIGDATAGPLSADQIAKVERALTQYIGPIARVLIKRALPTAGSEAALWERLATHIERPAERQAFLRQRSGG